MGEAVDVKALSIIARLGGFEGYGVGSNYWPMVEIDEPAGNVPGETLDALIWSGMLIGTPCKAHAVEGNDDFPETEAAWKWTLSDAGRLALAQAQRAAQDEGGDRA